MPKTHKSKHEVSARGPNVFLTQEETRAVLEDYGDKPLNGTLSALRDRCRNAASPVYDKMRKPL